MSLKKEVICPVDSIVLDPNYYDIIDSTFAKDLTIALLGVMYTIVLSMIASGILMNVMP